MMNIRNPWLALMCLLGSLAVQPACTKKKPEESKVSSTSSSSGGKKIFYHYRRSEEKSLDPVKSFDEASRQHVRSLFDTLLEYNYLKRPYELAPLLLTKMPEKQADGVTYLFTLKQGVRFHDHPIFPEGKGREMNVDDVIYSFKRFADANANRLSYTLIQGLVVGMDEFRELSKNQGFDYDKNDIAGLKKLDNYTFTITFKRDSPLNFYPLAFEGISIVPREAIAKYGDDFDKNPIGTGPFAMKTYSRRGTTILVKNPHYHGTYPTEGAPGDKEAGLLEYAGKKLPFVDEVHLPLIEETQPQMLKFKKGEVAWVAIGRDDFVAMVERVPTTDGTKKFKLKPEFEKQYALYYVPSLATNFMRFGMKDPIVGNNKALRQAIAYAMSADGFIELMLNGRGNRSESIVPNEIAGSTRETGSTWYTQNIEMAKKKLAEAGYPDGKGLPTLTIEYRSATKDQRQQYEFMRNELAKANIKVQGNFQSFSNFLKKTDEGNYQIADAGWNADYPDAENFYALFYGKNKAPGPNTSNFENAQFDAAYEKARHMMNGPERYKLFAEMDAILKEEVPMILITNHYVMGLLLSNVRNFKRSLMEEYPYKYLDLAD
jgi:oligopeptide transport system substrate-binding protein